MTSCLHCGGRYVVSESATTEGIVREVTCLACGRTPPLPPEREQMLRAEGRDGGRPPQMPQAQIRPGSRFWRGAKGTGA